MNDWQNTYVITKPNPLLQRASKPYTSLDNWLKVDQLLRTAMINMPNAVGIAMVQLGINKQAFALRWVQDEDSGGTAGSEDGITVLFNPTVILSGKETVRNEGCLSIPEKRFEIKRKERAVVKAYTVNRTAVTLTLSGWPAQIVQHENDHLNGILLANNGTLVADVVDG